jgi:hypothetical protein
LFRRTNGVDEINITNSSFIYQSIVSEKEKEIYGGLMALMGINEESKFLIKDCEFRNITTHGVVGGIMSIQGVYGNFGMKVKFNFI